ncbi:hypothetical protein [Streptomyces sp. Qhu-G9]|uniref:hypothetical protein n=1 Tax=Streptomyces sp. Qhu-G9 TaxID=3452799 RepID=UPI002F2B8780
MQAASGTQDLIGSAAAARRGLLVWLHYLIRTGHARQMVTDRVLRAWRAGIRSLVRKNLELALCRRRPSSVRTAAVVCAVPVVTAGRVGDYVVIVV